MILYSCYRSLQIIKVNLKTYKNFNRNIFYSTGRGVKCAPFRERLILPSFLIYRSMAGHAKWQNIKHIKAEKDRQKNIACNKYSRLISLAIKEKGPDPKLNNRLATLLDEAKRNNVPSSTLENAFKRNVNKKVKPGTIEILGPGGFFVILDYETDNISDTRHSFKIICKKYGANIFPGEGGKWRAIFEQKGIITVLGHLDGEKLDQETAVDAAIEAGAEDVKQNADESDKPVYEFLCAPDDLHPVKKELERKFIVEEAYVGYLPISTKLLEEAELDLANKFLDELGNLPDVCRIYENIE